MKLLKLQFYYFLLLFCSVAAWAQDITVTGHVTDESGLPVPGASVLIKGTTTGTATDFDGNFSIQASSTATLVVSYLGYASREVNVDGQTNLQVALEPSTETMEEIVVVGYGTQKKTLVTGAISKITARELEAQPLVRVEQSLQGRASGVTIFANAGQPGSASTVRVRGITSFNGGNNDPLWVVDGVIVENAGIGIINQSDIESIEVLKDAASSAIYGTRAGSGVILITTKKGKAGKITVNYNGFAGFSQATRKLDLLNAQQYAALRNEAYVNGYSSGTFQLPYPNAASLGEGTNWQDLIFSDNAERAQHELSVSGGNEKSNFYMSFGLVDQKGIVTPEISSYSRKNIRLNSDHQVRNWLKVGQTAAFSREKTVGLGNTNGEFGGPLASAINLDPVTQAIVTDPSTLPEANLYTNPNAVRDENGNYYGISPAVQREMTNPLAYIKSRLGNFDYADNFLGTVYVELAPVEGLKIRSTVTGKLAYYGNESFTPYAFYSPDNNVTRNSLFRSTNKTFRWSIENTAAYTRTFGDHDVTALIGQALYRDNIGGGQGVTYYDQPYNTHTQASFGWNTAAEDIVGYAFTNLQHTITSLFARVNYNYKERYLFTGILRRDGSSNFGDNYKFGVFPSVSLGWNISNEGFWKQNTVVNQFKLRGGYGIVGKDPTEQFRYLGLIEGGSNYPIGEGPASTPVIGNSPNRPANPDLRWEETAQTNVGIDATLFNDFTLTVEWYKKVTTGILQDIVLPGYVGATNSPLGNVADMENTGLEFELGYRKTLGDFTVGLNGNLSTLKNTVTGVGPDRQYNSGPSIQSSLYPLTRSEPGESYNSFYGFVTDGIFQNQAEIDAAAVPDDITVRPGDFRYKDLDGDGRISDKDRTYLGKPLPDFTYGFTINLAYKNFDLMMLGQGVAGNKIFQGVRRLDILNANWQTAALNRWTGEGTSNTYPRLTEDDDNNNFSRPSDFFLQDGDYFRVKIVQLGYSLPESVIGKAGLSKVRLYVTGENLLTFTKYTGYDPEIGGDVMGIDRGYYPQARSYMIGCNLQF